MLKSRGSICSSSEVKTTGRSLGKLEIVYGGGDPGPTPMQNPEEVTEPLSRWYRKWRRLATERIEIWVRRQWSLDVQGNILICTIKILIFPNIEEEQRTLL